MNFMISCVKIIKPKFNLNKKSQNETEHKQKCLEVDH